MKFSARLSLSFCAAIALNLFCGGFPATAAPSKSRSELFISAAAEDHSNSPANRALTRHRLVHINFDELAGKDRMGSRIRLNLFDDVSFQGFVEKVEAHSRQNYTLSGKLDADAHST